MLLPLPPVLLRAAPVADVIAAVGVASGMERGAASVDTAARKTERLLPVDEVIAGACAAAGTSSLLPLALASKLRVLRAAVVDVTIGVAAAVGSFVVCVSRARLNAAAELVTGGASAGTGTGTDASGVSTRMRLLSEPCFCFCAVRVVTAAESARWNAVG